MKNKIIFCFITAIAILQNASAAPVSADDGKAIFTTRCTGCHNVNMKVVGPALANVDQRHSIDWIVNFVHSSQTLVKSNDKEAVAVFNENDQVIMPDHQDLSADQIKSIVAYIKTQAKAAGKDDAPFARPPGKYVAYYTPISITNYAFFASYLTFVGALVVSLLIAVYVKELQRENKTLKENP